MNPRKWMPNSPLFDAPPCAYCGGVANSSDHTPPRSFLPRKFPDGVQAMTIPACTGCNVGFSEDEMRAAAIICTVSFTPADRAAVSQGGWVHAALQRNKTLALFLKERTGADGTFYPDRSVVDIMSRVLKKSAVGLLFFEFGRIVPYADLSMTGIQHTENLPAEAFVELHRRADNGWAEVTASGRELGRQALTVAGMIPRHVTPWKVYVPEYFEYKFIKRSDGTLMCAMKIHDALTALLECPWPSRAGPRRKGKPKS